MLPRCLLVALILPACTPATLSTTGSSLPVAGAATPRLTLAKSERSAQLPHRSARLAPPFANGVGTRRVASGEAATALVSSP